MSGSIYKRKSDNKWVGVAELEKHANGKRNRKTVYGDSKKEVEEKLNKIKFEIQTGEYAEPNKETFVEFLKDYHRVCAGYDMWNPKAIRPDKANWEETTASLYKMYIDVHFEPYFGKMKFADIKPMVLDKFYNSKLSNRRELKNKSDNKTIEKIIPPLSVNTVRKFHGFFKSAFNYAMANRMIKYNPTDGVKLGKKEDYTPTVYNEEQFLKLLKEVEGTDDEIPIILGGALGERRGEVFGLYWRNIDFNNKQITIEKTAVRFNRNLEKKPKNQSSQRTIIVPDYVIEILHKEYIKKGSPDKDTKVITRWKPGSYSDRFKKLLKHSKLTHIRFHDLRHYNAVIMMEKGVPDKAAADWLGHKDVQMLHRVYQHVSMDMNRRTSEKINEMFKPDKKKAVKKSKGKEK